MALFGRKPAVPQKGILITIPDYQMQIDDGSRPRLPHDGRYWAAMIETDGKIDRLIWEHSATYQEAKMLLKDFERTYGKKPKLASSVRVDVVASVWYAEPKKMPDSMLMIFHSVQLQYPQY